MSASGYLRRGRPRRAVLVLTAGLLALFAAPAGAGVDSLLVEERRADEGAVTDYWTPQRIARARPMEATVNRKGGTVVRRSEPRPRNHPVRFQSGRVPDPLTPPNTVNGKLYGKLEGFGLYECSATAVASANRNTIMTAGHCVADPSNRRVARKLVFIPSYDRESRPYGTWVYDRIVVLRSWRRNGNFNFDFAAVELSPRNGVNLEDVVGGAPVATGLEVQQTYRAIGYPANFSQGQRMRYCVDGFEGYDPHPIANGPRPIAMGCDMGRGASGGGWFVDGRLASVTSFGYLNHPEVSYGPYFGAKAARVYAEGAR